MDASIANNKEMSINSTIKSQASKVGKFVVDVLNGESLGIVITLIPAALLSQILPLFGANHMAAQASYMIMLVQSLLPVVSAFAVGAILKLEIIDAASIALAAFVSSGVVTQTPKGMMIGGTGVILNIILVILIASALTVGIKSRFGHLKMLLQPLIVLLVAGGIGLVTLAPLAAVQTLVGTGVAAATSLTPLLMGVVLGMIFAVLVVSPLSSVGIATAITLAGVGSGAANAGIVVASFTLAAMGASVNPLGATLAHFIGSPKIQMANMLTKPKLFIPTLIGSGIMGGVATLLNMKGTPFSAGFGFSGLIGPLTAYNASNGGVAVGINVALTYVILPLIIALALKYIFINKLNLIEPNDLKITLG
jgi:uncharacterized membrane protein